MQLSNSSNTKQQTTSSVFEKMHFCVTRLMFHRVFRMHSDDLVETWKSSWLVICRRAFGVGWHEKRWFWLSMKMKFKQVVYYYRSVHHNCSNAAHRFSWFPFLIHQVCSQLLWVTGRFRGLRVVSPTSKPFRLHERSRFASRSESIRLHRSRFTHTKYWLLNTNYLSTNDK